MKTKTYYKAILLVVFMLLVNSFYTFSQTYWVCGGNNFSSGINQLGTVSGSSPLDVQFISGGTQYMDLASTGYLGIGTAFTPSYLLDVSGGDINVSCATCYPTNSVGYRVGGNYMLWHDGNISNIYVGVGAAGGINNNNSVNWIGTTILGNNAGYALGTTTSGNVQNVTLLGYQAGYNMTSAENCTYVGTNAGYSGVGGLWNTFIGWNAGYSTNGTIFPDGSYNTFTGVECGYSNVHGYSNAYYGKAAAYDNDGFF